MIDILFKPVLRVQQTCWWVELFSNTEETQLTQTFCGREVVRVMTRADICVVQGVLGIVDHRMPGLGSKALILKTRGRFLCPATSLQFAR